MQKTSTGPSFHIGLDGWVFLGNTFQKELDQSLGVHEIEEDQIEAQASSIIAMAEICRRRGLTFLPIVVPAKASIYGDKIDEKMPRGRSPFDRIWDVLARRGYRFPDLRACLGEARSKADTYSRLNSHWSEFGGWVGWEHIGEWLHAADADLVMNEKLRLLGVEEVDAMNEFRDLAGLEGVNNWTRGLLSSHLGDVTLIDKNGSSRNASNYTQIGLHDIPVDVKNSKATNEKSCLVFADSTISSIGSFINYNFKNVYYRNHHLTYKSLPFNFIDTVNETNPDVVLYVMTERYCIFPIDHGGHLQTFLQYDSQSGATQHQWPPSHRKPLLEVRGNVSLDEPACLRIPAGEAGVGHVFEIVVAGSQKSRLLVSFVAEGVVHPTWFVLHDGLNTLHIAVPHDVQERNVWMVRDKESPPIVLISVGGRPAPVVVPEDEREDPVDSVDMTTTDETSEKTDTTPVEGTDEAEDRSESDALDRVVETPVD